MQSWMEQVSSPLPFTIEEIKKLNNWSVTFEEALALFNVDSSRLKLKLREYGISAWKGPNGSLVSWVDGDYDITIYLKGMQKRFVVKATHSFEDVIHMLEKQLNLSPGCYKLTTKHLIRRVGKVRVMTARDWDYAVWLSKMRGYIVILHLEVLAPGQTADGGNSTKRITKQRILSLNNGSVTFEQARASFNVDLSTFKARLEQLNIFVWKEVDGSLVRIHGGDYKLNVIIKDSGLSWAVRGTTAFEDFSRMLEKKLECHLDFMHGCEWHFAVSLAKLRGYCVILYLKLYGEDAHDKRRIKKRKRA
ncbi:hypothetical protein CTI12_AA150280 [Artemisia annua]|uniref:Uncharacterized protein n=1 Tax=Artemisia annua TaxID=35608 RepID=A0A2U1PI15_ARTAN|nr:hypothetical protein CTI12_AA150280 [Artemisia annua]